MKFNDIAAEIAADKAAKEAVKNAASLALNELLDSYCEMIESHMSFDPDTREVFATISRGDISPEYWGKFESNGLTFKTRLPEALNKRIIDDGLKVVCNSLHYDKVETEEDAYIWFSFKVEEAYV